MTTQATVVSLYYGSLTCTHILLFYSYNHYVSNLKQVTDFYLHGTDV